MNEHSFRNVHLIARAFPSVAVVKINVTAYVVTGSHHRMIALRVHYYDAPSMRATCQTTSGEKQERGQNRKPKLITYPRRENVQTGNAELRR